MSNPFTPPLWRILLRSRLPFFEQWKYRIKTWIISVFIRLYRAKKDPSWLMIQEGDTLKSFLFGREFAAIFINTLVCSLMIFSHQNAQCSIYLLTNRTVLWLGCKPWKNNFKKNQANYIWSEILTFERNQTYFTPDQNKSYPGT